jgi:hypothetical protein
MKSIDGHAMHNVFKRRQSLIDDTNSLATPSTSNSIPRYARPSVPTSISMESDLPVVGLIVNSSLSFTSLAPTNKGRMKGEYLQQQSQNIGYMASTMEVDSKQHLTLM